MNKKQKSKKEINIFVTLEFTVNFNSDKQFQKPTPLVLFFSIRFLVLARRAGIRVSFASVLVLVLVPLRTFCQRLFIKILMVLWIWKLK